MRKLHPRDRNGNCLVHQPRSNHRPWKSLVSHFPHSIHQLLNTFSSCPLPKEVGPHTPESKRSSQRHRFFLCLVEKFFFFQFLFFATPRSLRIASFTDSVNPPPPFFLENEFPLRKSVVVSEKITGLTTLFKSAQTQQTNNNNNNNKKIKIKK